MSNQPLTSIVINNCNYGRFLKQAVDSALSQRYEPLEVVVVDDGSTDDSRDVISTYGDRIVPVLKKNGGQGSAFNAGFAASRGEIVIFLDSDDVLLPTAAEKAVPLFRDPDVVKVHWPMWLTDVQGRRTGKTHPGPGMAEGDLRTHVLRNGPTHHLSSATSGNSWRRSFVDEVLPLPEDVYRTAADTPLIEMAPFFGTLGLVREPQSLYRQHDRNLHTSFSFERLLANELRYYEHYSKALVRALNRTGVDVDPAAWKKNSWWHRQYAAVEAIGNLSQHGQPIILVDDATWEPGAIHGRERIPFLERGGEYWGAPADDRTAIEELERLRRSSSKPPSHIVFAWSCFWWLEVFPEFARYLDTEYSRVLETSVAIAFDISSKGRR